MVSYAPNMNKNPEVDAWFAAYDNPQKGVVLAVRDILLAADDRIEECIKWKSPTFTFNGNLASFNPRSKKHASLMFHVGGKIPGDHAVLEGEGATAKYIKFFGMDDVAAKKDAVEGVVAAWVAWKG